MYVTLTGTPFNLENEKMLGQSKLCEIQIGDFGYSRYSDCLMALAISGGAEADSAINCELINALRPLILLNAVLKSEPLDINTIIVV